MMRVFLLMTLWLTLIQGQITTTTTLNKLEIRNITIDSLTSKISWYPAKKASLCPCNFVLLNIRLDCSPNSIHEKCNIYMIKDATPVNALRFESYHARNFADRVDNLAKLLWFHPQGLGLARGTHISTQDQSSVLGIGLMAKLAQMDIVENTEFLSHYAGYIGSLTDYSKKDPMDDFC